MPEKITITNYSNKVFAHPQFPAIPPGQTKSRNLRQVDIDSYSQVYDRFAGAGILVRFDDLMPAGVNEVTATGNIDPTQHLLVTRQGGITLTLPALADVPMGHRVTVVYAEGTGDVTVEGNAAETVQGQPNQRLTGENQALRLRKESDDNWAAQ